MIPDTADKRLHVLRQKLAVNHELTELIEAVSHDVMAQLYARTHGAIDNHAVLSYTVGEAKGVENFIKSITAVPTSGKKAPRT